eukprot:gene1381-1591_t
MSSLSLYLQDIIINLAVSTATDFNKLESLTSVHINNDSVILDGRFFQAILLNPCITDLSIHVHSRIFLEYHRINKIIAEGIIPHTADMDIVTLEMHGVPASEYITINSGFVFMTPLALSSITRLHLELNERSNVTLQLFCQVISSLPSLESFGLIDQRYPDVYDSSILDYLVGPTCTLNDLTLWLHQDIDSIPFGRHIRNCGSRSIVQILFSNSYSWKVSSDKDKINSSVDLRLLGAIWRLPDVGNQRVSFRDFVSIVRLSELESLTSVHINNDTILDDRFFQAILLNPGITNLSVHVHSSIFLENHRTFKILADGIIPHTVDMDIVSLEIRGVPASEYITRTGFHFNTPLALSSITRLHLELNEWSSAPLQLIHFYQVVLSLPSLESFGLIDKRRPGTYDSSILDYFVGPTCTLNDLTLWLHQDIDSIPIRRHINRLTLLCYKDHFKSNPSPIDCYQAFNQVDHLTLVPYLDLNPEDKPKVFNFNDLPATNNIAVPQKTTSKVQHHLNNNIKLQPEVAEESLVKDLMFVCQGIDGKYIKYYHDIDAFAVDPKVNVGRPTRDLVGRIAEFGWLLRQLRLFLTTNPFQQHGLTNQSLCSALNDELVEFYRLIALLETEVAGEERQRLTLRGMMVWVQIPLAKIRVLVALTNAVAGTKGGATVSVVVSFAAHGNAAIQKTILALQARVILPIYSMVNRWINDGELADPHEEFFIGKTAGVPLERVWRDKYTLRQELVPSLFSPATSRRILVAGKSINFMRACCGETLWALERVATVSQDTDLEALVTSAALRSNGRLMDLMRGRFRLVSHIEALRRYMLLGQGDFIQYLMDTLGEDLLKPAKQLTRHSLVGILESAVRNSNAQFDHADTLKRLDIALLDERPNSIGWDIFSLDYHIGMPLGTVVSKNDLVKYKKIFHFLWSVKRVEFSLSSIWRKIRTVQDTLSRLQTFKADFHRSHTLASQMVNFINNFQYYVMFEVIEESWQKMIREMNEATDLDQMIDSHTKYLRDICTKTFLTNSDACYDSFKRVLAVISRFTTHQQSLCSLAAAIKKASPLTEAQMKKIEKDLLNYRSNLNDIHRDYRATYSQFQVELGRIKIPQDKFTDQFKESLKAILCKYLFFKSYSRLCTTVALYTYTPRVIIDAMLMMLSVASAIDCTNMSCLTAALLTVAPGDTINLMNGMVFQGKLVIERNGTAELPITLQTVSETLKATIDGGTIKSGYVMAVTGSWWIIKNLKITNGEKGVMQDHANNVVYDNIEVYNIGMECVHFRDGSSYNTIKNSYIHDCGLAKADYGEGVYVGSDKGKWADFDMKADHNTISNNVIGPGVTAEHIDIKEGSSFTLVENNKFNGTGITGANSGDSFIDVKGNNCTIRYNTGYSNNNPNISNAFEVHQRENGWGYNADFYGNTVYLDTAQYIVLTDSKANATASNNTRIPADNTHMYSGNVISGSTPSTTSSSTSSPSTTTTTSSTTSPSTTTTSSPSTTTTSPTTSSSTTTTTTSSTTSPSTTTTTSSPTPSPTPSSDLSSSIKLSASLATIILIIVSLVI